MLKELDCMLQRFPESRERIYELFRTSIDFRVLCEDYWYSKGSLTKYREMLFEDKAIENEFSALCTSLEQEALRFLERDPNQ